MPLIYDPEFQLELDNLSAKVKRHNRTAWWARLIINAAVLGGAQWLLIEFGVSEGVMITAMVALATLCIVATVNSAADATHASLTILVGALEWIGRKQLGEYVAPEA